MSQIITTAKRLLSENAGHRQKSKFSGMSNEEPHPIGELVEEALTRIMRPDLLEL